jgi:hypothetical protein
MPHSLVEYVLVNQRLKENILRVIGTLKEALTNAKYEPSSVITVQICVRN